MDDIRYTLRSCRLGGSRTQARRFLDPGTRLQHLSKLADIEYAKGRSGRDRLGAHTTKIWLSKRALCIRATLSTAWT